MSKVLIEEQTLYDIGNAIRARNGLSTTYKPRETPSAIINSFASNSYNKLECYSYDGTTKLLDDLYVPSGSTYSPTFDYALEPSGVTTSEPIQNIRNTITLYADYDMSTIGTAVYSQDGTMSALVLDDRIVWFFNGFVFPSGGICDASNLDPAFDSYKSTIGNQYDERVTKAYESSNSENWNAVISVWSGGFRALTPNLGSYKAGTFYSTLECPRRTSTQTIIIAGCAVQDTIYRTLDEYRTMLIGEYISW